MMEKIVKSKKSPVAEDIRRLKQDLLSAFLQDKPRVEKIHYKDNLVL